MNLKLLTASLENYKKNNKRLELRASWENTASASTDEEIARILQNSKHTCPVQKSPPVSLIWAR
jgi:hypothetical protein